jgi:hypothetical protein
MSGDFGNSLIRFLKKVKRRIFPAGEGTAAYARQLRRELDRAGGAFAGTSKPVLIHTYGKVGSTAIHNQIARLPGFESFQTHFISEEGVAEAGKLHRDHDSDPIHLQLGARLREELIRHPEKEVRMITLVRDPVARAVSDLFENPNLLVENGDLRAMPLEQVVEIAAEHLRRSVEYTEKWFDRELCGLLGFDFFARPFDREAGFSVMEEGRFSLLVGKLELLSKNGARYLGEFLGRDSGLEIPKRRARSATGEASLYRQVRANLRLPEDVLNEVYESRVPRHFYSGEEISGFRETWVSRE